MRVLHCPLCTRPFKPPVLQCNGRHLACGVCVAALPGGQCEACEDGGIFGPCPALDAVVSSAMVACPNAGCERYLIYHEAGQHKSDCPHAPCHCTEPNCVGFAGSPAELAAHLSSVHAVPVHNFKYGKDKPLQLPASVARLLLVAEDDGRVFLLTVNALAVSLVCVRATGATLRRFRCTMWVTLAPPPQPNGMRGRSDMVLVEMQVRTSLKVPRTSLKVPRAYLVQGPGDGQSMEVDITVRIDEVNAWFDFD